MTHHRPVTLPLLLFAIIAALVAVGSVDAADKAVPAAETWQPLFDGKSMAGWRGWRKSGVPDKGWRVEDGLVKKIKGERSGDIVTERQFENFDLRWEWRIAKDGNNGVKYLVTEARANGPGHEYQLLDDDGHPDGKRGPKRQTASFYDVLPPTKPRNLHPPGEWNSSRIVVEGTRVEHWLNEDLVLDYELESDPLKTAIAASKFKDVKGFGMRFKGHIMLTDHGDECWFRNMRIRELPAK